MPINHTQNATEQRICRDLHCVGNTQHLSLKKQEKYYRENQDKCGQVLERIAGVFWKAFPSTDPLPHAVKNLQYYCVHQRDGVCRDGADCGYSHNPILSLFIKTIIYPTVKNTPCLHAKCDFNDQPEKCRGFHKGDFVIDIPSRLLQPTELTLISDEELLDLEESLLTQPTTPTLNSVTSTPMKLPSLDLTKKLPSFELEEAPQKNYDPSLGEVSPKLVSKTFGDFISLPETGEEAIEVFNGVREPLRDQVKALEGDSATLYQEVDRIKPTYEKYPELVDDKRQLSMCNYEERCNRLFCQFAHSPQVCIASWEASKGRTIDTLLSRGIMPKGLGPYSEQILTRSGKTFQSVFGSST